MNKSIKLLSLRTFGFVLSCFLVKAGMQRRHLAGRLSTVFLPQNVVPFAWFRAKHGIKGRTCAKKVSVSNLFLRTLIICFCSAFSWFQHRIKNNSSGIQVEKEKHSFCRSLNSKCFVRSFLDTRFNCKFCLVYSKTKQYLISAVSSHLRHQAVRCWAITTLKCLPLLFEKLSLAIPFSCISQAARQYSILSV